MLISSSERVTQELLHSFEGGDPSFDYDLKIEH